MRLLLTVQARSAKEISVSRLHRITDRVLDKLVGRTTAAAGCYEQVQECSYVACQSNGLRRRCRTCTYTGSSCQYKSCGAYTYGGCMLP
ncbi:hypothetical protein AB0I28_27925 [Phytomonospora sp. NPDC050363]|uniref:hypothetical protein n=1 Tax=Phytomonospora sp. NPDC050363 TaxID=3155642 RepID=UPI0033F311BC